MIFLLYSETWIKFPQFSIVKKFLQNIKDAFVKSAARRHRYITHLKHHGIVSPCKIPLPNATRWNSWFKMVLYTKEYINYWPHFFESKLQENSNNTLLEIHNTLQNEHERGIITIYVYLISTFSQNLFKLLIFSNKKIYQYFLISKQDSSILQHI